MPVLTKPKDNPAGSVEFCLTNGCSGNGSLKKREREERFTLTLTLSAPIFIGFPKEEIWQENV